MATHQADIRLQLLVDRLRTLPQPSWPTVLAAVGAAALAVWWIMARQAPTIDPQSVISANLAAAHHAVRHQRFVEPFDRSALHHFTTVLALDPTNVEARAGLDGVAEHFAELTKSAIVDGRIAEGAVALETLRRIQPSHRRIALLDAQLRRAIDERALLHASAGAQVEKPAAATSIGEAARRGAQSPPTPPRLEQTQAQPQREEALGEEALALAAPESSPPIEVQEISANVASAPAAAPAEQDAESAAALQTIMPPSSSTASEPSRERTLVTYIEPAYPREAMMRGIEGWIDVQMSVTPAGDVIDPSVQDGKARRLFERAALAAVRRWKYDARPEAVAAETMTVRVSFELQD